MRHCMLCRVERLWSLIIALLLIAPAFAQELSVESFNKVEAVGQTDFMKDNNGTPCALVKVVNLGAGAEFENTYVVGTKSESSVYLIFMAQGAKKLKIKHPDFLPKDIVFEDYGVKTLKSAVCYELKVKGGSSVDVPSDSPEIQTRDAIYKQGWAYQPTSLSLITRMIIQREALAGKQEAQVAMAQICLSDRKVNDAVSWVRRIIENGDSTCLDAMSGELLYHYAVSIPQTNKVYKEAPAYNNLWGYIVGQLEVKDQYMEASNLCEKAFTKGYKPAKSESEKLLAKSDAISTDALFQQLAKDKLPNDYKGWPIKIIYPILQELSRRGSLPAKDALAEYDKLLLGEGEVKDE